MMPFSISFTAVITLWMVPALPAFFSACARWNSAHRVTLSALSKMPRQLSATSSSAACS
nr:MAG: hypothetical protein [Bacteriophage sp.]